MIASPPLPMLERFRLVVQRSLGLEFHESRCGPLAEVLDRRLAATGCDAETYLRRIEAGLGKEELRALAQMLTVTETSFFRNPDQIRAFAQVSLPDRFAAPHDRPLQILSAGCASGEEPYTLAACVREHADSTGRVEILAVDVNPAMLRKAAAARFSDWSLRQTPAAMRSRLFRADGDAFILDEAVRSMVAFDERNLATEDPGFWYPQRFDIIFCRNVLMYFAPEIARTVVDRMALSLSPGGYLFLGHAETLRGISSNFHLCHTHGTFYYRRKDALNWSDAAPPAGEAPAQPGLAPERYFTGDGSWVEAIHDASRRVARLVASRPAPRRPAQDVAATTQARRAGPQPGLEAAAALLESERYSELQLILRALPADRAAAPEVLLLAAVLETHGGNIVAAERMCHELLAIDELNAGAHYLAALCCESRDDPAGAARHDRIAAYLEPTFAMPRLHLGRLARRAGDRDAARRDLAQALLLIEREDSARLLLFGGGFARAALAALCRSELAACGDGP